MEKTTELDKGGRPTEENPLHNDRGLPNNKEAKSGLNPEVVDNKENIKEMFNKWGTYQSLQKDALIVRYFLDKVDQRIRQKTIIENFKGDMDPMTCRKHLYKLVNKNVLQEDQSFKGTYFLPSKSKSDPNNYLDHEIVLDVNNIIKLIMGKSIYDLAFSKLISDYEKRIKDLKEDLENCRNQLMGLR